MKTCKACGRTLDVSKFAKSKNVKDGYENKCKECRNKERKQTHKLICLQCGKMFNSSKKNAKYCSIECQGKAKRKRVIKNCSFCGCEIEVTQSKALQHEYLYCNQKCRTEHLKVLMSGENNPNYAKVDHVCDGCGKVHKVVPYKLKTQKYIFCSNECYVKNIGKFYKGKLNPNFKREKFTCSECGKTFEAKPSARDGVRAFCSIECYRKAMFKDAQTRVKERHTFKCSYCGKEFQALESQKKGKKFIYCSRECKNKSISKLFRGSNHPRWNPKLSKEERLIGRKYPEYREWRTKVFERDNYICQKCGYDKGGKLVAHHIENYSQNKSARLNVDNGITLCESCHKEFHDTYGYTNNNKEQLTSFLLKANL